MQGAPSGTPEPRQTFCYEGLIFLITTIGHFYGQGRQPAAPYSSIARPSSTDWSARRNRPGNNTPI